MAEQLPPGNHRIELDVRGTRREYLVHIPRAPFVAGVCGPGGTLADFATSAGVTDPGYKKPVVMLLHGTGGVVAWTQTEAMFDSLADRNDIVVVYPQALPPDPSQPPKFLQNPPAWEVGDARPGRPVFDDIAFFRALLNDLPTRTPIDASRIYATGFSNGASMCFRLAAELSDRIAAIAPVAGYCRINSVTKPVPTLYIIGEVDPMVPPDGGQIYSPWTKEYMARPPVRANLERWASLIGCSAPSVIESDVNGVREEIYPGPVEFRYVTVEGLGHHWPGGKGQLKPELAGPWNDRLNANQFIWQFLRRHRLDEPEAVATGLPS